MSLDRQTFHESWYRVAHLKPRLLHSARVFRQHYRGRLCYVIENTANNQYTRLDAEAYAYVGLLNGRRTVAETWRTCCDNMGDRAPTQGEVIQILGQLYAGNLLFINLTVDSESLFDRYRKRKTRQVQSTLMNLLFIRIPLLDPDRFLNVWAHVFGVFFTWIGFVLWLILVGIGLGFVISNRSELIAQSQDVLAPGNLIFLYLTLVCVKIIHEFSHAFACKTFGRVNKSGGQVHTMGIMFLVFFPLPYMDASSAWAFASKWHRAIVGLAGILVELALAAITAIVWANTSAGTLHIIAYNVIFVASVSTMLFNGNPLLRFDAYYVLADLVEIPNLAQRSKNYLYYLVKRYAWGVKKINNPAYSPGESIWFLVYGIASTIYRIFICVQILLFLNDRLPEQFFLVVPVLIFSAIIAWVLVPLGQFGKYLFTSQELQRSRFRALTTFFVLMVGLVFVLGILRLPDYCRLEGIVEPNDLTTVYMETDGFIESFTDSGASVAANQTILLTANNTDLEAQQRSLKAQRRRLEVQLSLAYTQEAAATQIIREQITALTEQIQRTESQLAALQPRSPLTGHWFSPDIDRMKHVFAPHGQSIGQVGNFDHLIVRGTIPQTLAALIRQAEDRVEIRPRGYPGLQSTGTIYKIAPAGREELPSQALGYTAGGSTPVRTSAGSPAEENPSAPKTAEKVFEFCIRFAPEQPPYKAGQRVMVRVRLGERPLLQQWFRSARQLFQRRFYI